MDFFIQKIKKTIDSYSMLEKKDRLIVAISGGADSVCLLKCLTILSSELDLELLAVHINHNLRGIESYNDQEFVKNLCKYLNIKLKIKSVNIKKMMKYKKGSLEKISREVRYNILYNIKNFYNFEKVATAHNINDQAETILLNILRGSGVDGLKGISPIRDFYIRPFIEITKQEILIFLKKNNINYCNDLSNLDNIFRRNKIRNSLIPYIEKNYNPSIIKNLEKLGKIVYIENIFLEKIAQKSLKKIQFVENQFEIKSFLKYEKAIQYRMLKIILEKLSGINGGISYIHLKSIMNIIHNSKKPSIVLNLPYKIKVLKEYNQIKFDFFKKEHKNISYAYIVKIPSKIKIKQLGIIFNSFILKNNNINKELIIPLNKNKIILNFNEVSFPLIFRTWKLGDKIQPFGMNGHHKKIHNIFIDKKIPQNSRKTIPILTDNKSILWIPEVIMSERLRIKANAKLFIQIEKIGNIL